MEIVCFYVESVAVRGARRTRKISGRKLVVGARPLPEQTTGITPLCCSQKTASIFFSSERFARLSGPIFPPIIGCSVVPSLSGAISCSLCSDALSTTSDDEK